MKSSETVFSRRWVPVWGVARGAVRALFFLSLATTAHAALVSHWSFDEGGGYLVTDSVASNDGNVVGGATWTPGILGGGMTFDGTGYVLVYNAESLNPRNLTVSAWVKTTATQRYTGIVDKWSGGYLLDLYDGYARFNNDVSVLGTALINDGSWHLVTGTYGVLDAASSKRYSALYVDGVQVGLVEGGGITDTPDQDLIIGGALPSTYGLPGEMDDVGVWDHGLWTSEATALYGLGVHPDLKYNLNQAQQLFDVHRAYAGSITVGGLEWKAGGSLGGDLGAVVKTGNVYTIRLDDKGNGLTTGTANPTDPPEPPPPPTPPTAVLEAYWNLDEGSGTVAADSVGGYPGTLGGTSVVRTNTTFDFTTPTWTSGKFGGGLSFAGGPYNPGDLNGADAVVVPLAETDLQDADLSVSVWVKTTQNADYASPVSRGWGHNMGDPPGGWMFDTRVDQGLGAQTLSDSHQYSMTDRVPVNDGQWHLVVMSYWSELEELRCYVDGGDPLVVEGAGMGLVAKDIIFGGDAYSSVHFAGQLDDIGYWSGVLSGGEAKAIYSLAQEDALAYDLGKVKQLFDVARAGSGQVTIGGLTWAFASGLDGDIGLVAKVGDDYFLRLDDAGNGVATGGSAALAGDLNGDGTVSSGDLDIVRGNWGQSVVPGCLPCGDASGDGMVNSADLDIVRANWGRTAAAAVPEPGLFALLAPLAVFLGIGVSRRRLNK